MRVCFIISIVFSVALKIFQVFFKFNEDFSKSLYFHYFFMYLDYSNEYTCYFSSYSPGNKKNEIQSVPLGVHFAVGELYMERKKRQWDSRKILQVIKTNKKNLTAEFASYILSIAFLYLFKFLKGTISPCYISLHSNPIILNTLPLSASTT